MKYRDKTVRIEFNQLENKFSLNHFIIPTSVIGGADCGISFSLTYASLDIYFPTN